MMREVCAENQLSIDGNCAGVAQLVEQHICNVQVVGSSPITSSIGYFKKKFHVKMGAEMPWPIFAPKRSADKL